MSTVVEVTHDYPVTPERLWALALDLECLGQMNAPLVAFDHLPDGSMCAGQVIDTRVSLYGRLPAQPYRIEILSRDDADMTLFTHESGSGLRRWDHRISVTPVEDGARLTDRIEIDAGLLTPVYAWWARKLYRHRDIPRRRLLGLETD